jgi:thiamine-phosphate pyrophosphorylase
MFPDQPVPPMPSAPTTPVPCSLYLISPELTAGEAPAFAGRFAEILRAAPISSALIRFAPGGAADAKTIVPSLLREAIAADCALLIEGDARLAARLGADGVHVNGAGADLTAAIESLKPARIVGASVDSRDDAMTAGELGADYVMFGWPSGRYVMDLEALVERVRWWSEIFETPCVAFAPSIDAAAELARAGADFVALGETVWTAASPASAARAAQAAVSGAPVDGQ